MKSRLSALLNHPLTELLARFGLAATFLFACTHKILHPDAFAKIIYGYKLMPGNTINLIAITLPYFELVAGLALVLGIFPRAASLILGLQLVIFMTAISFNLARGLEFDCGCFSVHNAGEKSSPVELLIRDAGLLLLSLQVLFFKPRRWLCLRQTGSL